MKFLFTLIFFTALAANAQKVQLVHNSGYTHDYAIGQFLYVETPGDTSRAKYIATFKTVTSNSPAAMTDCIGVLRIKSKEAGANCFIVDTFIVYDTVLAVIYRTYFAPAAIMEKIEKEKLRNQFFVFSATAHPALFQNLKINDTLAAFKSNSCIHVIPPPGRSYKIKSSGPFNITSGVDNRGEARIYIVKQSFTVKHKPKKAASFFMVFSKKLITEDQLEGYSHPFGNNMIAEIDYNYARPLLAVFKEKK